jgi:hypothetical protein
MDEQQALDYLNTEHEKHFIKKVTMDTLKRWRRMGKITSFTEDEIDRAVLTKRVPPKRGRPSRYSQCDIESIIEACKHMPQGVVAQKWECDPSYVSRLVRGER